MKMMKVLVLCFLALTSYCLIADALVPPNSNELNDAAGTVVRLLTQDLLNKQLQDVSDQVSLTLVKLTEFQNPSPYINFQEATGISLALYGVSVKVEADWSYERSANGIKIYDDGSLTASTKASVKLNIRLGSEGQLNIECLTYMSELNVRNKGTVTDLIYNLLISAFKQVRSNLENVVCQSAKNAVNSSEVKDLFTKYLSG